LEEVVAGGLQILLALFGSGAAQRLDALNPKGLDDRAHDLMVAQKKIPGCR